MCQQELIALSRRILQSLYKGIVAKRMKIDYLEKVFTYKFVDFLRFAIESISAENLRKLFDLSIKCQIKTFIQSIAWLLAGALNETTQFHNFFNCHLCWFIWLLLVLHCILKFDLEQIANQIFFFWVILG